MRKRLATGTVVAVMTMFPLMCGVFDIGPAYAAGGPSVTPEERKAVGR